MQNNILLRIKRMETVNQCNKIGVVTTQIRNFKLYLHIYLTF